MLRAYRIQQVDDESRVRAIDFVIHGDERVAGPAKSVALRVWTRRRAVLCCSNTCCRICSMPKARDVRKSLPLTVADLHDLSLIRSAPEYRESLRRLTGAQLDDDTSEAAYLHAVLAAGIKVTREYAEASGYAEIAATQEPADQQRHQSARRRVPAWAKE